jgi:hypothetical protein
VRPQPPGQREHCDGDDEVRDSERDPSLLGEALVQHVPGRQAELRFEEEDDADGAEEEADDEAREPRQETASELGRSMHASEATHRGMPDV